MSEIAWSSTPSSSATGPHRDYSQNLRNAQDYCSKVAPLLPSGIRVQISSSQGLVDNMLMLTLSPPKNYPMGNFAIPVSLHQSRKDMESQMRNAYDFLIEKLGRISKKESTV